jgi:predicted MFS family arabinose efflux permease
MFKFFKTDVNLIVRILVLSDFFLFFSTGLLSPIYAVFILDRIEGAGLEVVGFATAIYWISRVISVIPLSRLMDKIKGEKDEYYLMMLGTLLISALPLFYIFIDKAWQVYIVQFFNAVAFSLVIPAWRVIFTKNMDKDRVGFEWSLDDVGVGIATAMSAALGSFIASRLGFEYLFVFIFLVGLVSVLVLLILYRGEGAFLDWLKDRRSGHGKKGI